MKTFSENLVDSVVTDPPYELGFMGKAWDKTGIAYNVDMWKEILRVLKPGGYLLSFGGTRTYHRMACAIEDAGFEIRDMVEWMYGSGFPKSLNIGKTIDKLQGNGREVIGTKQHAKKDFKNNLYAQDSANRNNKKIFGYGKEELTKGNSDWEGWGTALKPAHEPICMARKPLSEKTVAENVLKWGTGGINVDGCRVPTNRDNVNSRKDKSGGCEFFMKGDKRGETEWNGVQGRFPANLIHDGSEEVVELFLVIGKTHGGRSGKQSNGIFGKFGGEYQDIGDSGSAARFFYCAKASKNERGNGNNHPTVKPIVLMKYLIKLITPPNGIVLDNFMGSGSIGKAAILEGFNFIGIENEGKYCEISVKRLRQEVFDFRKEPS
jgi:site-specific DNA-methyltransferase (adenine-specific)